MTASWSQDDHVDKDAHEIAEEEDRKQLNHLRRLR